MIRVKVEVDNVLSFACDALVLKYAQGFYGAGLAIVNALASGNSDKFTPSTDNYILTSSNGKVPARQVLFVGTVDLSYFDYAEIRKFSTRALSILSREMPNAKRVAMTVHGVNFGLDETESFLALIAGILDAVASNNVPPSLEQISIIEIDPARAKRLQQILENNIENGLLSRKSTLEAKSLESRLSTVGLESSTKLHVFVAMPFTDELEDTYVFGISSAVNSAGYLCERIDSIAFTGDIMERMKARIETASFVIGELTGANPNVYLEVGYAWGRNRPTILLVKNADELKFDVHGQRCIIYKNIVDLNKQLETFLNSLQ